MEMLPSIDSIALGSVLLRLELRVNASSKNGCLSLKTSSDLYLLQVMEVYQLSPDPEPWAFPPLVQLLDAPQTWVQHRCMASRDAATCRPGDLPRSWEAQRFSQGFSNRAQVEAEFQLQRQGEGDANHIISY